MRTIATVSIFFLLIISCTGYKTHHYPEPTSDESQDAQTSKGHVDFYSRSGEDQLDYAKQFLGEGNYEQAGELFLKIYDDWGLKPGVREEALLNLGRLYSNILNPNRNYQKTILYLEMLLKEFPDGSLRSDALASIASAKEMLRK